METQLGGGTGGKILAISLILFVLVGVGLYFYYMYQYNQSQTSTSNALTPSTYTPPASTPAVSTPSVDCPKLNSNYRSIPYTSWTDNDRNTAIWIINNQYPTLQVSYLQGLNNATLQVILQQYCGPITTPLVDCVALNGNYRSTIDYTAWTDNDRNTAIWLVNKQNPTLDVPSLQGMNNATLQKLVKAYCQ